MTYDEFIGQVQHRARLGTQGDAVKATQATLETLAERLIEDELKDLAAQLPSEIAYYLHGKSAVLEKFGLHEFFERVGKRENVDAQKAVFHARVVISVLCDAVTAGEIDDVRNQLPAEYAPLFESGSQGAFKAA